MSTTDPRVARIKRERRAQGSPVQAFLATVCGLLSVVAGASLAYGFLCVWDQFRLMAIVGDSRADSPLVDRWPGFLFPGIFGILIFGTMSKVAADRFGGRYGRLMSVLLCSPFGAAAVFAFAPILMTRPATVGVNVDPDLHTTQKWGPAAWIWYRLPDALPVVGLLLVAASIALAVRKVRQNNQKAAVVQHGTRTTGRVIEVNGGFPSSNRPATYHLSTVSVQFTDAMGTVRYVTKKRMPILATQMPVPDQQVLVIYDPANPADQSRIQVVLNPADAVDQAPQ